MSSAQYQAQDIEVLSGLEPVQRRPGMYTDTARPNHLAQEVIDNSVDEAIAGHCKRIDVKLYKDGSLEVSDDGRGMPVDKHPKEKIPGVELILTRLHAGGYLLGEQFEEQLRHGATDDTSRWFALPHTRADADANPATVAAKTTYRCRAVYSRIKRLRPSLSPRVALTDP